MTSSEFHRLVVATRPEGPPLVRIRRFLFWKWETMESRLAMERWLGGADAREKVWIVLEQIANEHPDDPK